MCERAVQGMSGGPRMLTRMTMLLTCSPSLYLLGRSGGSSLGCCCITYDSDTWRRLSSWILCLNTQLVCSIEVCFGRGLVCLILAMSRSEPLSSSGWLIWYHHLRKELFLFFPLGFYVWSLESLEECKSPMTLECFGRVCVSIQVGTLRKYLLSILRRNATMVSYSILLGLRGVLEYSVKRHIQREADVWVGRRTDACCEQRSRYKLP